MKILVLGDVHGDIEFVHEAMVAAESKKCKRIVQLGDFGYFPNFEEGQRFLADLKGLYDHYSIPIYFIDGNHDDCSDLPRLDAKPYQIQRGLYYLPRNYKDQWGMTNIVTVGGAYSIDRHLRILGVDYWEEEVISAAEFEAITECDTNRYSKGVMFCHDCPARVPIETILGSGARPIGAAECNRKALEAIAQYLSPHLIIHGHYHRNYAAYVDQSTVIGLDCNQNPNRWRSMMTLEL